MMNQGPRIRRRFHQGAVFALSILLTTSLPLSAFAQEQPSEAPATVEQSTTQPETPSCTSADAGCGQGESQGVDQGVAQGGPSLQELGGTIDEQGNTVLPSGVSDTRQGAGQGATVTAENTNTGAGSTNTDAVAGSTTKNTAVTNTANDSSAIGATATTGGNTNDANTSTEGTTTGNANIGVTQVKNDNTTAINGTAGVSVSGQTGDHVGDLNVDFANAVSLLGGDGSSKSVQAVNNATGSDSSNSVVATFKDISNTEVQNDGKINNTVDAAAITGQNDASKNTSDGSITTGNANVAATLVNLLNTTVLNGNLLVSVQDIFGNLIGNITVPDIGQMAAFLAGGQVSVDAQNSGTGSNSTNTVAVNVNDQDKLAVKNNADVNTKVDATAITGQNEASANTGGGQIDTGDATVAASNVTVANTTVEGGNWGLVIVNALNRWLGFLVGDSGQVRALSQDETIREIEARNSNTGSDSTNAITVNDTTQQNTQVTNNANINNNVTATAITGQNTANMNTGAGRIVTGKANIVATAVNLANTTVKNANLGIAVINVFGNWFGDLLYGGSSLLAAVGAPTSVAVDGSNTHTGADSTNAVTVDVNRNQQTDIKNKATIHTTLATTIDTGNNKTNKNTNGGDIETGIATVALHARTIANLSALLGSGGLSVNVEGENGNTGVDSKNTITAKVNDTRTVNVTNDANVSTILPGLVNTGNNEASFNTVGGGIDTGTINADVAVDNLVNRVIFALGGQAGATGFAGDLTANADLINELTGYNAHNSNTVEATRQLLSSVFDKAVVDTLINLLFNTGSNQSNSNTAATPKSQLSQASYHVSVAAPTPTPVQQASVTSGSSGGGTHLASAAPVCRTKKFRFLSIRLQRLGCSPKVALAVPLR